MTQVLYQLLSSSNFAQNVTQIFHTPTRSLISWQSTQYAIPPIDILIKLQTLTFVTELYLHPKKNKYIKTLQIMISEDNHVYTGIAKVYDLNDAVRVQISCKCRYLKLVVLDKERGKAASIDLMRVYGHPYFKYQEDKLFHTQKKQKIDEILMQYGFNKHENWDADPETMITLHDMSKLRTQYALNGNSENLKVLSQDIKKVLKIGRRIRQLQKEKQYLNAKDKIQEIKDLNDQIKRLQKKRDSYDEKYETSRFQQMIAFDDLDNNHDEKLMKMLQQDMHDLQEERRKRQEEAMRRQQELNQEFEQEGQAQDWWKKENELDQIQEGKIEKKPKIQKLKKEEKKVDQQEDYKFKNPYVYNQGDADMQKHIRPLLNEFGGDSVADPELLRKYQQLEYLDILGARIWISAHSQNWRQRAAAVEAVLNFSQDKLPQRYSNGKTKNLFLALMEFARINAEDKVLQIYYTSLKILTVSLQPPICGEDVAPALINKGIQKFMSLLIQKISEMNTRAKEISLKQLITIFKHPVADINIAINECLKLCREELNLKFIPVDKQNPRLIMSRLQIIGKLMQEFKFQKRKIDLNEILSLLIQGSLYHTSSEVRVGGVKILQNIYKIFPEGTLQWFKNLKGLKPNIESQLKEKLKIN